ncbi:hypothetical protein Tco_0280321 [Tanacetum coccineum]
MYCYRPPLGSSGLQEFLSRAMLLRSARSVITPALGLLPAIRIIDVTKAARVSGASSYIRWGSASVGRPPITVQPVDGLLSRARYYVASSR